MADGLKKITMNGFLMMMIKHIEDNIKIEKNTYLCEKDGLVHCSLCDGAMQRYMEAEIKDPPDDNSPEYIEWEKSGGELPRIAVMRFPSACTCREEKMRAEEKQRIKWENEQRIKDIKSVSLMDEKFFASNFETCKVTKHNQQQLKICKRYLDKFDEVKAKNQGLLLHGDIGTGKTHLAACIANGLINQYVPVVMTSFVRILQSIQGFKNDRDEERLMDRLMSPSLLIIDDLGAERDTSFAIEKVYNVIDSRYRARKPMILTTNLTVEEMKKETDIRYLRIYDRVFEVCYPVEFTGPSWRKSESIKREQEMKKLFEVD